MLSEYRPKLLGVINATGIVSFPRLPSRFDAAAAPYRWLHSIDVRTSDLAGARRITYASLPALVRKARVKYEGRTTNVEAVDKEKLLGKMSIRMVLQGNYEGLRQFIYDLERSPEFVIIDDLSMVEGKGNEPLTLTINLSTYYRLRSDGV